MVASSRTANPDLVLINPAGRKKIYQGLGDELSAIEPPVWAGLMATFVRRKGYSVEIVDAEAEELGPDEAARRAIDSGARLIAISVYGHQPSASTQVMGAASGVCTAIKQLAPDRPVVLIGGHVAALPEQTLREEAADFVAGGEGLFTLVDLLEALKTPRPHSELSKVRDLWYREGNGTAAGGEPHIRFTTAAPLLQHLEDEMPGVAWDLLPMRNYRAHNWHALGHLQRQPYAAVYTTLGCPYKCTFCCIQAPFKSGEQAMGLRESSNSYRFWSPKRVVDDLEHLATHYGVRNVKFADEMFVLNRKHVEGICDLIVERKLDLNIWAYARVDTVKDGMLPKLKAAGFNWLCFGIEAANANVRGDVQKGFDQSDVFETLRKVWDAGIYVLGNYIFGLPEDDEKTMQETLDMAVELNCEWANFYSAMAYPGSQLYKLALEQKWPLPESWNGYSQHSVETLPLPTRHLTAGEVLRFRDKAFDVYFTGARYLEMVEKKFGAPTVQHIKAMASQKLTRKNA